MLRALPSSLLYLALCLCAGNASVFAQATAANPVAVTPSAASAPAYQSDPRFKKSMLEAKVMEKNHQYTFVADTYKSANKIAGGQCSECMQGMYRGQMAMHDFKAAIATTASLEALAKTPRTKSYAQQDRASAMLAQAGEKAKPEQLDAVHAQLRQALDSDPRNASALYLDGAVLAREGKMDAATASFKQCAQCMSLKDPSRLRVEHFAGDPELSTHKMAPAFEVTALDGSKFNLDAMGGRVVLIDFWATWCGPCNAELPHMKQLAKKFAGQPLVIISVSWDKDEAKWKEFVAKNEMTWIQYRDADHALGDAFAINAIPHYFTIDTDGVLTAEMLGEGSDVEGKLKKLLAKANEANQQKSAVRAGAAGR